MRHYCPETPILLVGTKSDLRENREALQQLAVEFGSSSSGGSGVPLSRERGQKLARKIRALKYMECSALTQKGLRDVFDESVRVVINPKAYQAPARCEIL